MSGSKIRTCSSQTKTGHKNITCSSNVLMLQPALVTMYSERVMFLGET